MEGKSLIAGFSFAISGNVDHSADNTLLGACDWISLQVGNVDGCEQCKK